MPITSGSKVIRSQNAFLMPSNIRSMYLTPKNVMHCHPCGNRDPGICYYSGFRVKPGMTNKGKKLMTRHTIAIYFPNSSSFLPASGKKRGDPNLSTPNVLMIPCVSFETMKSAKAFPPGTLTLGHLAGFTSMT